MKRVRRRGMVLGFCVIDSDHRSLLSDYDGSRVFDWIFDVPGEFHDDGVLFLRLAHIGINAHLALGSSFMKLLCGRDTSPCLSCWNKHLQSCGLATDTLPQSESAYSIITLTRKERSGSSTGSDSLTNGRLRITGSTLRTRPVVRLFVQV